MKIQRSIILLTLLFYDITQAQGASAEISVAAVKSSLSEGNPKATLEMYFSCEKYEGSAYEKIATGSASWISLAEQILEYSDACYTGGIQAALGSAMQVAPSRVLPLVDKTPLLAAQYICLAFISADFSVKSKFGDIAKSKSAIRRVNIKGLQSKKASCLAFIKTIKTDSIGQ